MKKHGGSEVWIDERGEKQAKMERKGRGKERKRERDLERHRKCRSRNAWLPLFIQRIRFNARYNCTEWKANGFPLFDAIFRHRPRSSCPTSTSPLPDPLSLFLRLPFPLCFTRSRPVTPSLPLFPVVSFSPSLPLHPTLVYTHRHRRV